MYKNIYSRHDKDFVVTWRTVSKDGDPRRVHMGRKRLVQIRLFLEHGRQHHGWHPAGTQHSHFYALHWTTLSHVTRTAARDSHQRATLSHSQSITVQWLSKSNLAAPSLNLQTNNQSSNHRNHVKNTNTLHPLSTDNAISESAITPEPIKRSSRNRGTN